MSQNLNIEEWDAIQRCVRRIIGGRSSSIVGKTTKRAKEISPVCSGMQAGDFQVIRLGLEPKTYCLEGSCSIQLSYRTGLAFY